MIYPLQTKTPDDWPKHTYGLDDVRFAASTAFRGHRRTQQVVQPENVRHIEISQPRRQESICRRIPAQRPVAQPGGKINGLDAVLVAPPAEWRTVGPRCRNL